MTNQWFLLSPIPNNNHMFRTSSKRNQDLFFLSEQQTDILAASTFQRYQHLFLAILQIIYYYQSSLFTLFSPTNILPGGRLSHTSDSQTACYSIKYLLAFVFRVIYDNIMSSRVNDFAIIMMQKYIVPKSSSVA